MRKGFIHIDSIACITDVCMYVCYVMLCVYMDGWMDGWMDRWMDMDGWMCMDDGWVYVCMYVCMYVCVYCMCVLYV